MNYDSAPPLGEVIEIDKRTIRNCLGQIVRGTVVETLNAMPDHQRGLHIKAGVVQLEVPKLRTLPFDSAVPPGASAA